MAIKGTRNKASPTQAPTQAPAQAARPSEPCTAFPVVGIGASAGGLEAFESFLRHLPVPCGIAFVIVQHLDPIRKGMLVELLQTATVMPVTQVVDRTKLEPNRVYVIAPNKDLSILNGVLHLLAPSAPKGLRLPIDFFFQALAAECREKSIGVILSGMGSDGTQGLRAIKDAGGGVFVQSPTSAKFDAMPRSAIDAGLADLIAPVEELPAAIIEYLRHAPRMVSAGKKLDSKTQSALEKITLLLRMQTGNDFSLYKKNTLHRRVQRRMGLHHLPRIEDYVSYLQQNPAEAQLLFKELLIGVTSFFRDPAAWEQLKTQALPELLASRPDATVLRAWVPGCSTGEEAYSLAMVLSEAMEESHRQHPLSVLIFATDLDPETIEKARQGFFPSSIAADVVETRLKNFFVPEENGYRINKKIRSMILFATQNLVMDPPFTRLDIITCRNLLIYLTPELQRKLMPLLHYSLNPGGLLMLGTSETIGNHEHLFAPLPGKMRLYRRVEGSGSPSPADFPAAISPIPYSNATLPTPSHPPVPINMQALVEHHILGAYAPAAVLTTPTGDILYISGRTGPYLEAAAGKANWNILAMAREDLRHLLQSGFRKALSQTTPVTLQSPPTGPPPAASVRIVIETIHTSDALRGLLLFIFFDVPPPPEIAGVKPPRSLHDGQAAEESTRNRLVEDELHHARIETQNLRQEMRASQDDLHSINQELQSANEELQSTNEELLTSKEEMQSMNEELQTVNHELQSKLDELNMANNDMKNLLNSTNIATLFLNNDMNVRRFTISAGHLIKLIPTDVGRPITDIASNLVGSNLVEDAREVLQSQSVRERRVSDTRGRWFLVRIMPYRTHANKIDGVVITFTDISSSKNLEAALQEMTRQMESLLRDVPQAVFRLDEHRRILFLNPAAEVLTGRSDEASVGQTLWEALGVKEAVVEPALKQALEIKSAVTIQVNLETPPPSGRYHLKIEPQGSGLMVVIQRLSQETPLLNDST